MKILYYEVRKCFLRKSVFAILGILLILNAVFSYVQYRQAGSGFSDDFTHHIAADGQWDYWQKLHQELDGEITKEKVRSVTQDYKKYQTLINQGDYSVEYDPSTNTGYVFGDYSLLNTYFYKPLRYLVSYQDENSLLIKHARENVLFYEEQGNNFEMEKNQYIINKYQDRNPLVFYDTQGWKRLFEYDFSDVLIFIMMFLCIVPCFYLERKGEMEQIILSTSKGKCSYIFAKYLSFYLCATILVLIFSIYNYAIMDCLYGLSGGNMKLFSLKEFQYTPLNLSMLEFYILLIVFRCIALCGIVTIFGVIAKIFSNVITIFLVMIAFVIVGLYGGGFIHSISSGGVLAALCSPFSLLQGAELYKRLSGINVAGHFVPWLFVYIAMQVLLQVGFQMLLWGYMKCFSRRRGYQNAS